MLFKLANLKHTGPAHIAVVLLTVSVTVSGMLLLAEIFDLSISHQADFRVMDGCERPEYYHYPVRIHSDQDDDLMDDGWELFYGLDPYEDADSSMDIDYDGYSNREEFEAGTDPEESRSFPGIIKVMTHGFDCFYTAELGMIDDDGLVDILIRDPSEGFLPMIRDIVLIQQPDSSFVLHDAQNFQLPELTSISEAILLVELNGDHAMDLALIGISDHISGARDQILFAPTCHLCSYDTLGEMPKAHFELGPAEASFFSELDQWITSIYEGADYFTDNAAEIMSVPLLAELTWVTDPNGLVIRRDDPMLPEQFLESCNEMTVRCFSVIADENDYNGENIFDELTVEYLPDAFQISITDKVNDPEENDVYYLVKSKFSENEEYSIKDYSKFNQEALYLARNELKKILETGVMWYPSDESEVIYNILSKNLGGVLVFEFSYRTPSYGKYPTLDWGDRRTRNIAGSIQTVLRFVADRYTRFPYQYP